jgi:hypothetical protein
MITNNMSQIDIELEVVRNRLAFLEQQKQKEAEKPDPLHVLEDIIDKKRKQINNNSYSKSIPLARFYDQEKLAMLEPIFNMLKDIQARLDLLESK